MWIDYFFRSLCYLRFGFALVYPTHKEKRMPKSINKFVRLFAKKLKKRKFTEAHTHTDCIEEIWNDLTDRRAIAIRMHIDFTQISYCINYLIVFFLFSLTKSENPNLVGYLLHSLISVPCNCTIYINIYFFKKFTSKHMMLWCSRELKLCLEKHWNRGQNVIFYREIPLCVLIVSVRSMNKNLKCVIKFCTYTNLNYRFYLNLLKLFKAN